MRHTKTIGKHTFVFEADIDGIKEQIEYEKSQFEDNYYQRYYTVGYDDGYLTKTEHEENLNNVIHMLEKMTKIEHINEMIDSAKKKKNGTLYKGRIADSYDCDNTVFITEWHNTWIYNRLVVKAINDTMLLLSYEKTTSTPA